MNLLCIIDTQGAPRVSELRRSDGSAMTTAEEADARDRFQRQIREEHDQAVKHIVRAAEQARQRGDVVLILEDVNLGNRTHAAILHALGSYPHITVRKGTYDGSEQVLAAMAAYGLAIDEVAVCGCLTGCCVLQTVVGLRKALGVERVRVLPGACFDREWNEGLVADPRLRRREAVEHAR